MDQHAIGFRPATKQDQQAIQALVQGERLNSAGINWPNFLVAAMADRVIGAVQVQKHPDGSRELGSLVVASDMRGHGIASRLIDRLLADEREPLWMIADDTYAETYARWGFEPIEPAAAPVKVRSNWRMRRLTHFSSFFRRQTTGRLVILERLPKEKRGGLKALQRPAQQRQAIEPGA